LGYRRLGYWINWQAMKRGISVITVDPRNTSTACPACESKLVEIGYRRLRCLKCDFEADRDLVGALNIRRRAIKLIQMGGSLITPTAPQMTDVNPNRWGEPMTAPKGTLTLQGREEVSLSLTLVARMDTPVYVSYPPSASSKHTA